ncbi:MAG: FmdB family zinc ribbon protein [Bdellovibrionales bacterium]
MPTYEYECDACGHNFDEFQSMSAERLKKCPKCGKNKLRRLIGSGAAIIFKGSGFYETDYRSESYKSAAKAEQDTSSKTENSKTDSNGIGNTSSNKTSSEKSSDSGKSSKSGS